MTYSIEDILEEYRENNLPAFTIYEGKERRKIYEGKDIEEGEEILSKFLNRKENGSFKVRLYKSIPKAGIDDKTPTYLVLPYERRYTTEEKNQYWQDRGLGGHMIQEIRDLKAEIAGLKTQLDEPETDDELEKEAEPGNIIGQLMGNPQVQNVIAAFLTNLSANMFSNHVAPPAPGSQYLRPHAMAGIDDQAPDGFNTTAENKILDQLFSKGVTWNDLALLAAMPPEKISFLLNMLRNGI